MAITYIGTCDFKQTHDFTNLSEMLEPILVPEYFASMELGANTVTFSDSEENTIFSMAYLSNQMVLQAYTVLGNVASKSNGNAYPTQIYRCKHGVLLRFDFLNSVSNWAYLLITKNQNGQTALVLPNLNSDYGASLITTSTTNIVPVSWNDSAVSNFSYTRNACGNYQTVLVPFVTIAGFDAQSYTPNAFWIPIYQYSEFGKLTINGVDYLHTGCWAIKDE